MNSGSAEIRSIRVWTSLNLREVRQHLLLIDDLYGSCANCRQIGLNYTKDKKCSNCSTHFRYVATRLKDPAAIAKILRRLRSEGLELQLIDREDFERSSAKDALQDLFQ